MLLVLQLKPQAPWVPEAIAWRIKAVAVAPAAKHMTSSVPTFLLVQAFRWCKVAQAAKAQAAELAAFLSGANTVLGPEAA